MKVALIGNMNNNHFVLMRYLRDVGVDAHLLMYRNEFAHFLPECDTWSIEKWRPFIRQLSFRNGKPDILRMRKSDLRKEIDGFDFYIGNGMSPALFRYLGRKLDIFIPYCEGIEFIVDITFDVRTMSNAGKVSLKSIGAFFYKQWLRKSQISGLRRNVGRIVCANLDEYNQKTYRRYRLPEPKNIDVPLVYLEEPAGTRRMPDAAKAAIGRLRESPLVVFSHCSHIWKTMPDYQIGLAVGKRNNWLIQGFADYVAESGNREAVLALFEYGPDVRNSKDLVAASGIAGQVVWFPVMERKDLMEVIPLADIGGSEFSGQMWGGSGREFIACGVPMLHMLTKPEGYAAAGISLPPFFNVSSPRDITDVLLANNRDSFREMGMLCKEHFNTHNGHALARKYRDMMTEMGVN